MLKKVLFVLFALAIFVPVVPAQNVNISESPKKPGDTLRYTLTLDGSVKGTVAYVGFAFQIMSNVRSDQNGLLTTIQIFNLKLIADNKFEVEGVIPQAVTGKYRLGNIEIRTKEGGDRIFSFPDDFKQEVSFFVENNQIGVFPKIKSIEPTH